MTGPKEENNRKPDSVESNPTADLPGPAKGPGSEIGHFRIEREIGRGGMGVVYLGRDTTLDRVVAIKSLPPELMSDPRVRSRLRREARLLASLSHPNIATIHEEFQEADEGTYLILEYVAGETLAERISGGPLELEEVLSIAYQTAAALAAAHGHGIIHRDLKPGNIKITPEGTVKVLDFGLAKAIEAETQDLQSTVTQPGRVLGTPAYMSPEQAAGDPVDHRTDIWSLGVVIYEMLTGEIPFKGDTDHGVARAILCAAPTTLRDLRDDVPVSLEKAVSKMLQKERMHRYEGMGALLRELEVIGHESMSFSDSPKRPSSIAVLPFVDMSPRRDQEYFCDGIAEELINALTQIKDLHVIARTSAFSFKGRNVDVREMGRQLNVGAILEGSVRKAGNRLRITAQLVDTVSGHHLWSQRYDREMDDVFAIQDEITLAIVDRLGPKLLDDKVSLARRQTVEAEVYNLYLRGLFFRNKRTEVGLKKAIECFQQAIRRDPNYALAYAGLAASYSILPLYSALPPKEAVPKAKETVMRALQIDETLPEAHTALGYVKTWYERDWGGAERAFKRAIELNPGYADVHYYYSFNLVFRARFDEALEEIEQALELDPVSVAINREIGTMYCWAGEFGRAIGALKKTLEMDPSLTYTHCNLGLCYLGESMYEEALTEFQREREVSGGAHAWAEMYSGFAYVQMGQTVKAQEVLDNLLAQSKQKYVSPFILAGLHFVLGKNDTGFELLDRAYEGQDPWLCFLKTHRLIESIRSDPRYATLLKKTNLDD